MNYERLDEIATDVAKGEKSRFDALSTGERIYVALAANDATLLDSDGFTLAQAITRLGTEGVSELIVRWQYRKDPRKI
jgi:hypothetical protein